MYNTHIYTHYRIINNRYKLLVFEPILIQIVMIYEFTNVKKIKANYTVHCSFDFKKDNNCLYSHVSKIMFSLKMNKLSETQKKYIYTLVSLF